MKPTVSSREEDWFHPPRRLGGVVLAKPDRSSLLRRRVHLSLNHPVNGKGSSFFFEKKEDSSLTITAGAGFSPSVKKPLAVTKGEGEEDSSLPFCLWLSPKVKKEEEWFLFD